MRCQIRRREGCDLHDYRYRHIYLQRRLSRDDYHRVFGAGKSFFLKYTDGSGSVVRSLYRKLESVRIRRRKFGMEQVDRRRARCRWWLYRSRFSHSLCATGLSMTDSSKTIMRCRIFSTSDNSSDSDSSTATNTTDTATVTTKYHRPIFNWRTGRIFADTHASHQ